VVAALVLAGGYFLVDPVREAFEDFDEAFEDFGGEGEGAGSGVLEDGGVLGGYRNVSALVRALNEGGLRCRKVVVDQSDQFLTTGSCQAGRTHVQINIYRRPEVLESALEIFQEGPFTWVHDGGWFVITQPRVARKVHQILGGELRRPQ
jgi:hypothetical protein